MTVIESNDINFDISVPVAIVGSGAAGLIAALSLTDVGIAPLVLERDKVPRGSTGLSSGMIPACGTNIQAQKGIEDSIELLTSDIVNKAKGQVNLELVDAICRTSGPTIDWLVDTHAIELTLVEGFIYPGHSRLRMHAPPSRQGIDLISNLTLAAEKTEIDILTEAHVKNLYREGNKIIGIGIERPDGSKEKIGCDVIILACNGFGGNQEMVKQYIPDMAKAIYFGHPGNQGDAINWGKILDAQMENLGSFQGHGSVAHPHGILITWALMTEGGIQVNSAGKRFTNEHEGYSEQAVRVIAQKQSSAWNIYDHRLHELGLEFEEYREANKLGAVKTASTIEELAGILNISRAGLVSTIKECEDFSSGKQKDVLQRDFTSKPPLEAPYYSIQVTGALFHTQGGLTVNGHAQVLQKNGEPFPNLLASGGAATGISGPADWGYLSGNGLLSAVTLGRIAGQTSARLVKH